MSEAPRPLSPLRALAGKHILLLGTTGFLAKVMLAMLLERFSVGKVYCLVRPQRSKSSRERFFDEVVGSEMMEPLRKRFGQSFDAFVHATVEVLSGDVSEPNLGLDAETLARLERDVDLVINSAGLVNFNPPLDAALEVNTVGAAEVAKLTARCAHAKLVHISTCFVAGNKSGRVREDTPIVGYFPKQDEMRGTAIDWQRELKDCQRAIEQVKARTDDATLEGRFRKEAIARLEEDGRDLHDRTVRAAITNQRRRWVNDELVRIGTVRAQHWGWPNSYTYSKALGEQAIASTEGLDWAIVRPSIVESALEFPFPGWNEGMNTSAPLAYLGLQGQVQFPGPTDLVLDLIPVDYVASATIAAAAALLEGETKKVYQASTGDSNPYSMARVITTLGLYKRRKVKKDEAEGKLSWLEARWKERSETLPVTRERYERVSAPAVKKLVGRARKILDGMEPERYGPFGGLVSQARRVTKQAETDLGKVIDIFDLFMPFIWENKWIFRSVQTRSLFARMDEADRALLPFEPEKIDWRTYWLDVHVPGLEKWVFPKLDVVGPKRIAIPRNYRDLAELFESKTEEHARRVAFRMLRKDATADSFTYRDVRRAAEAVADFLRGSGVESGDRVAILSESRPEWGMSYFGILLAGATAVPIDPELSAKEIKNIVGAAQAKGVIASEKQQKLLAEANGTAMPPIWSFATVFERAHDFPLVATKRERRRPEDVASIIFTSGTTGTPKGVMLTDRNFTALTARVSALFDINRTDALLSVLPLQHTFEFSTGLLMPLSSGASVTYLEERTPELLQRAFEEVPVTAIVGVPALWETLHRKMVNRVSNAGRGVELFVRALASLNRKLRDKTPWNVGRWLFRPMHGALGGRVRYMISGGAALEPKIADDMRGFGFNLYQGYGLTEASPVITVGWPGEHTPSGSVGWPLPGIEVRIHEADDAGVGEVIARGPTIMAGYLGDAEATSRTVVDGWLHTGDRGRLDEEGRLYIVGREKDVIIDVGGKNVYPDEVEQLYAGCSLVKDLSVVGIPADHGTGERVAALVVPDYEAEEGLTPEQVREKIREHFREVGSKQPIARRIKVLHIWETPLPRTSTRKVKRAFVREQIIKLERTLRVAREGRVISAADRTEQWVRRTVASIAQKDSVAPSARLVEDLGFDSLMQLELVSTLEAEFPNARVGQEELAAVETVADLVRLASRDRGGPDERAEEVGEREEARPVHVPAPVATVGKALLGVAQRMAYTKLLDVKVDGRGNIPANTNFIVASNHTSHLDMGLVKTALGGLGGELATLAAKDYFFDDPLRRAYFENFTNLLPIDRHGSLKKSLRMASESLRQGASVLIFPEGTRSRDGTMIGFKPSLGYLALNSRVDVVPMFLSGTHDALPVGAVLPRSRDLHVKIGTPIRADEVLAKTKGWARAAAYRYLTDLVEDAVRELGGLPPIERKAPQNGARRGAAVPSPDDGADDVDPSEAEA